LGLLRLGLERNKPTGGIRMRLANSVTKFTMLLLSAFPLAIVRAEAEDRSAVASSLQPFIENHTLAGAVTLVATKDRILDLGALGFADLELKMRMQPDALFWIASMTKPITATALMMLIEESKLKLDDPVEMYLPEFKGQMLVTEQSPDHMVLKKPARPITVRDLLTHTSGLVSCSPLEGIKREGLDTLREEVLTYGLLPLHFQPGSKYEYNSPGIATAGRLIEVLTKTPYEQFLQKRLFAPLGMTDTTFFPSEGQLKRLAKSYKAGPGNKGLHEASLDWLNDRNRVANPAGGLFSTASDVAKFCQMILGKGEYQGKRYLSEKSVRQMTTTQTAELTLKAEGPDTGYGLGWQMHKSPHPTFGHGGKYNTWMWIDPSKELIFVLMMQYTTFRGDIRTTFHETALKTFGK
jgi:CubicO group peptidase (beta-lactamase class C family)